MEMRRNLKDLDCQRFNDEGNVTQTSEQQEQVEEQVYRIFLEHNLRLNTDKNLPRLLRWEHTKFLVRSLSYLPESYQCLDASRTWLCYWILHPLSLLNVSVPQSQQDAIINFLKKCQCPDGGFGGGPGQIAHLATTYAAVNALCIIGTQSALDAIDKDKLKQFLWDVRMPDGSFCMHRGGEVDIRGVYCALSVAVLTGIMSDDLFNNTAEWIVSCQTYEGGFAGTPDLEAHGGYTFCGVAGLIMLNKGHLCDTQALLRWIVNKQMRFEGGFQGRTNKLVDGCYSFWQGGVFLLIHTLLMSEGNAAKELLFNEIALQEYILLCCQHNDGGLLDKPGKPRDIYHTCYTLSGLAVAQHSGEPSVIVGPSDNELQPLHPVHNIAVKLHPWFRKSSVFGANISTKDKEESLNNK